MTAFNFLLVGWDKKVARSIFPC